MRGESAALNVHRPQPDGARAAAKLNYHQTFFRGLLAERHVYAGELDEAQELLGRALASGVGERWFEAEPHRLRGGLLLASPEPDAVEAEACLRRALVAARAREARLWERRAATSLAGLCRDQGKPARARDVLASVYGWFIEAFDTADLQRAEALLTELTSAPVASRATRQCHSTTPADNAG